MIKKNYNKIYKALKRFIYSPLAVSLKKEKNKPIYGEIKYDRQHDTYENYYNFNKELILLKYGDMAVRSFEYIESNLPIENFKKFPGIPVVISFGDNQQITIIGLIDSGSTNSFIDVHFAKKFNGVIIDTLTTCGVNSNIETKPVISVKLSVDSMEGKWIDLNVGVIETKHPNHNIILGRDFMELFKRISFDFENQKTILDY